ncbi:hypothetical protein [Paracraurococcus ruber]|uniref:hypothetical protein n=1 Tax=Paracraurococcus ruber TaxID=77675 RepID=UPI0018651073|nr:hypothetical protein [Paracraurococcus ruber]
MAAAGRQDGAPPSTQPGAAAPRPAHRRAAQAGQRAWIVFGGQADQPWLRLLRPGFRHCFAVLQDAAGWTVLDPLSGRLVVARLEVPAQFDLPGFYRRAGLAVTGPFVPGNPRGSWLPPVMPFSCVALCRAVLGSGAPFALTPWGLFRKIDRNRKNVLTVVASPFITRSANGRVAP